MNEDKRKHIFEGLPDKPLEEFSLKELITIAYHSTETIVAFIDILGFEELIAALDKTPSLTGEVYLATDGLSSTARLLRAAKEFNQIECSFFSDSIVLSKTLTPASTDIDLLTFFQAIIGLQSSLLCFGHLTRGGVAIGKCFHRDNFGLFGRAVIDAYHLEKGAKYPRVLVSDQAIQRLESLVPAKIETPLKQNIQELCLKRDSDNQYFVDYLRHWFDPMRMESSVRDSIIHRLQIYKTDSRKYPKYQWLGNYYNDSCATNLDRASPRLIPLED